MRSTSVIVGTVSSVLLIGVGVALYLLTPPDFEGRFRTAIDTVLAMQQLGAEWSVETARVRADPTANFDGLAAFVPRMQRLRAGLAESLDGIADLPQRLVADAEAMHAAIEELRERVEHFKTAYAVIRNSERFLPLASADLIGLASRAGNTRLALAIEGISLEMEEFLSSPSEAGRSSLHARLPELAELAAPEAEEVAALLGSFSAHANVLLDRRMRTRELFEGITSSAVSERADPLIDGLESEIESRRRVTTLHQRALTGLGAGVLLVWIGVGFARRSARSRLSPPAHSPVPEEAQAAAAEPEAALGTEPASTVAVARTGGDPRRDDDGVHVTEAAQATDRLESADADEGVHDDADARRDGDGMDAVEAPSAGDRIEPVPTDAAARGGAQARRDEQGMDAMEALLAMNRLEPVRTDAGVLSSFPRRQESLEPARTDAGAPAAAAAGTRTLDPARTDAGARGGAEAQRDEEGMDAMDAMEALFATGQLDIHEGVHDGAEAQRDGDGMDAMEALLTTHAFESVRTVSASPAGSDEWRAGTGPNVLETLLTGGAFAGLLGQTVGAYARRIRKDATVLDSLDAQAGLDAEEAARRVRRLRADARRIGFFAHRMVLLGRHLAPHDRESIDVIRCLDEVLDAAAAETICVVDRHFKAVPGVWASRSEVRLILAMCVGHVLRAFQGMDRAEAGLEIRTMPATDSVTIAFIHNGARLPADQDMNQFIPFYGSRSHSAALQLPAARHLARKYGGMVDLGAWPDERGALSVRLSVNAGRQ